jgi:predicted transcriptional regulator
MGSEIKPSAQTEVIARHLTGDTNTKIAKDMSIARNTVARILSDAQVTQLAEETKSILLNGSPRAAKRIIIAAAKDHSVGFELLDRLNILVKQRENGAATQVNVALGFEGMAAPYIKEEKPEP